MTDYNVTVGKELLPELLSSQDGLAKLVEGILNQILEAQVTESLCAEKHERADERIGYRNGYRSRQLYTRVGPVTLQVLISTPKGPFRPHPNGPTKTAP